MFQLGCVANRSPSVVIDIRAAFRDSPVPGRAKDGHLDEATLPDALFDRDAVTDFLGVRVETVNTRGASCSYFSHRHAGRDGCTSG
jgi:hypothetical protein